MEGDRFRRQKLGRGKGQCRDGEGADQLNRLVPRVILQRQEELTLENGNELGVRNTESMVLGGHQGR